MIFTHMTTHAEPPPPADRAVTATSLRRLVAGWEPPTLRSGPDRLFAASTDGGPERAGRCLERWKLAARMPPPAPVRPSATFARSGASVRIWPEADWRVLGTPRRKHAEKESRHCRSQAVRQLPTWSVHSEPGSLPAPSGALQCPITGLSRANRAGL